MILIKYQTITNGLVNAIMEELNHIIAISSFVREAPNLGRVPKVVIDLVTLVTLFTFFFLNQK